MKYSYATKQTEIYRVRDESLKWKRILLMWYAWHWCCIEQL